MPELVLGPLLRYVDEDSATVWVETDSPCTVSILTGTEDPARPQDDTAPANCRTWHVAGHHYALVPVTGLRPGSTTAYRVALDDTTVWPLPGTPFPPSTIRTLPGEDAALRVAFGSCRWARPDTVVDSTERGAHLTPDALNTLATGLAAEPGSAERPDVLLLLGDQVYADEISPSTRDHLDARRGVDNPPGEQVADYEEYTYLYRESWLDPALRWLLSTVPTCMIFDDHDVIDDWNTSGSWLKEIRATSWWSERILGGLTSYWVYQHLGNLSPTELEADELYAAVRAAPDGAEELRAFAAIADNDPATVRWSYRRDFGRVRLLMVDSRAARVLEEGKRALVDPAELSWVEEQATDGSFDHLLLGTSLPWLLPHTIHDLESWNEALCDGRRGGRWALRSERLRRRADLEHWAAFRTSFDALARLFAGIGRGDTAPADICVLSGDVHHAYMAEAYFPGGPEPLRSRVVQLTCSPVHNAVPIGIRVGFRLGWSWATRWIGRALAWHGKVPPTPVTWKKLAGPYFGNQLMTLTMKGRTSRLRLEHTVAGNPRARLETEWEGPLS